MPTPDVGRINTDLFIFIRVNPFPFVDCPYLVPAQSVFTLSEA